MIEKIGKYRILERIGRGGMGTVFKAHDPILDRLVALKVISSEVDVNEELKARFYREAQACAKLNHPNVIIVYDLGEDEGQLFIVMEFLEGEELKRIIAQRKSISLEDKLALMIQVCDGLHYAHQKGIVHRDIKPGNIFVLRGGQVKILDFGIARIASADSGLTRTGLIMGTLRYMSPEQARGRVDHRSDIFSAGSVFYELLAYRPAFMSDDPMEILEQLRSEDPPPLTEVDPSVPSEVAAIIERALRKDPAQRFQDLAQMRAVLEQVRRRLTEEAERLQVQVRAQVAEVRELHAALARRLGESLEDETRPVVDERARLGNLRVAQADLAGHVARLRARLEMAERLEPVLARGLELLQGGTLDAAVAEFECVLRDIPDHRRAREGLRQAREAAEADRRQREAVARLVTEARAALEQRVYAQCLALLAQVAPAAPGADRVAEVDELRRAAQAGLAAEAVEAERREALRREAAQAQAARARMDEARTRAERAEAVRHAVAAWSAAETAATDGRTAFAQEAYARARQRFEEATAMYARAEAAAREALGAVRRARAEAEQARDAMLPARAAAEAAAAAQYAAPRWAEALAREASGHTALAQEDYAAACARLGDARQAYEQAAQEARAVAALAARRERLAGLVASARELLGRDEVEAAERAVGEALALDPELAEGRALLERVRARGQELAEARRAAAQAREAARAAVDQALEGDDPQAAAAALERLTERAPSDPALAAVRRRVHEHRERLVQDALTAAGRLIRDGRLDRVPEALGRVRALAPGHPDLAKLEAQAQRAAAAREARGRVRGLLDQARRLGAQDELEQALGRAEEAVGLAPDDARALRLRDELHEQLRRARQEGRPVRSAEEAAAHARDRAARRERIRELLDSARELLGRDEVEAAERAVREVLALDAGEAEARALLERAQARGEELARAQRAEALVGEAKRLLATSRFDEALRRVAELVALVPEHPAAAELRAKADEGRRQAEARRAALEALVAEGEARLAAGDARGARERFEAALAQDRAHAAARRGQAEAQARLAVEDARAAVEAALAGDDPAAAAAALRRLAERAPGHPDLGALRGRVEEQREQVVQMALAEAQRRLADGQPDLAAKALGRVRALAPEHAELARLTGQAQRAAEVRDLRGRVRSLVDQARKLGVRGELSQALALAEEAVSLAPDDARALRLRDDLQQQLRQAKTPGRAAAPAETPAGAEAAAGSGKRAASAPTPVAVFAPQPGVRRGVAFGPREMAIAAALLVALIGGAIAAWQGLFSRTPPVSTERVAAEELREKMRAAREAAVNADAEQRTGKLWAAAVEKQREADAAFGQEDFARARAAYGEALAGYQRSAEAAREAGAVAIRAVDIRRFREQAGEARRQAELARAAKLAPQSWERAAVVQRDAEEAVKRQDPDKAEALFRDAQKGFQQAAREASEKTAAAERERLEARKKELAAAEQVRDQMVEARDRAEEAGAARYAPKLLALAQDRDKEGQAALGSQEYPAAQQLFREAQQEYQKAAQEAQKQVEQAKSAAEQGRTLMSQARGQAEQLDAKRLAAKLFAGAEGKERDGQAALGRQEYPAAQQFFREAQQEYQQAAQDAQTRFAAIERDRSAAETGRAQMTQAREQAEKAAARALVPQLFAAAEGKERDGQAALGRREYPAAQQLFREAQQEYQQAAQEARKQVAAVEQAKSAAEQGRALMSQARGQAEQVEARQRAAKPYAAAEGKERDGQAALGRQEFARAQQFFREAQQEYERAAEEAKRVAALERDRSAAEQGRAQMVQAKGQAEQVEAKQRAAKLYAAAEGKERDGQAALGRQEYPAAQQLFREAQQEYQQAAQEARKQVAAVEQAKSAAEQGRALMSQARGQAEQVEARQRADKPYAAAEGKERDGQAAFGRQEYTAAQQLFREAQQEYRRAAEEARRLAAVPQTPAGPDSQAEIRKLLDDYKRAIESKDLALFQRVRPGLSPTEVRQIRASFERSRSQRVDLTIQSIDVRGDQAEARGRRRDEFVSTEGQTFRNEASFVYKLRRTASGWVIDAVQ